MSSRLGTGFPPSGRQSDPGERALRQKSSGWSRASAKIVPEAEPATAAAVDVLSADLLASARQVTPKGRDGRRCSLRHMPFFANVTTGYGQGLTS
jgi:hypothetical protein